MKQIALYDYDKMDDKARAQLCVRLEDDLSDYIAKVTPVIEAVREEGDDAIARFIKQFDGADVDASSLLATQQEFDDAFDALDDEFIEVLRYAADNIRRFHEMQKPQDIWWTEIRPGVKVGERATPIQSVALYSPRGKGSFPSVTLMTAIPLWSLVCLTRLSSPPQAPTVKLTLPHWLPQNYQALTKLPELAARWLLPPLPLAPRPSRNASRLKGREAHGLWPQKKS